ncbi:hypothetical protein NLJ89_g8957 [Agrocybe chaxingu]|uniref:Uncharacterized protein n=1 Tax=Agrocybe chaxingu TaxID=84603 RepID=A0A9W8JTN2_9AGAR|nr:hypothetical protein NLJ89_g8957 [Agrocybe chaxingu]
MARPMFNPRDGPIFWFEYARNPSPQDEDDDMDSDGVSTDFVPYAAPSALHATTTTVTEIDEPLPTLTHPTQEVRVHHINSIAIVCMALALLSLVVGLIVVVRTRYRARKRAPEDEEKPVESETATTTTGTETQTEFSVRTSMSSVSSEGYVVQRAQTESVEFKRGVLLHIESRGRVSV